MESKLQDLIVSAKGTVGEMLAEEVLPELAREILKGTVIEVATGVVGGVIPGVGNVMMRYQQRRWEKNMETLVAEIVARQDEINRRFELLDKKEISEIAEIYFPLVADYVQVEKQKQKIPYMAIGFTNIVGGVNFEENIAILFYDTLSQLSIMEIEYLSISASPYIDLPHDDMSGFMKKYKLDIQDLKLLKEKLLRLNLLKSKNEGALEENMKSIMSYVEDMSKNKKNVKLSRLKHIYITDSHSITGYGIKFVRFFQTMIKLDAKENSNET